MLAGRRIVLLSALLVGASVSSPARADLSAPRLIPELTMSKDKGVDSAPEPDPWTTRKKTISLQGGAPGGPTGLAGFSFEYAPIKYVVLGTGAGYAPEGVRGALMPRLRLPINRWFAVGLGFPFSFGPYQFTERQLEQCQYAGCSTGFTTTRTWTFAAWGHLEPNIEIRLKGAIAMRVFGGYSKVLNNESDSCNSTLSNGCPSQIGEQKWYGGFALGYAW